MVSSYLKDYLWSQETNEGFCAAMLKFGYFDNKDQADKYTKNDYVETSRVIIKKLWMDACDKTLAGKKLLSHPLYQTSIIWWIVLKIGEVIIGRHLG